MAALPDLPAAEVLRRAAAVPGMLAFFAIVGSRIAHGDCAGALRGLRGLPIEPRTAWRIVERWQAMADVELLTGWTPEAAAMAAVMAETDAWARADWSALIQRCVGMEE